MVGIEIKPGKPLTVEPEDGYIIHVSQVTLGELKKTKEDENVPIYVKVGDDKTKLVIGTLSQKFPQVSLDLFFEQEFELSHNSKSSVFLLGYKTIDDDDEQYPLFSLPFIKELYQWLFIYLFSACVLFILNFVLS